MSFTFPKSERLCSKSEIENIFRRGKVLQEFPFKLIYTAHSASETPIKVAFSVPKKKHRRAVDRNLLKRRIREAYRLNSITLKNQLKNNSSSLHVFFIYLSDQKLQYKPIEDKIILLLHRLEKIYEENPR